MSGAVSEAQAIQEIISILNASYVVLNIDATQYLILRLHSNIATYCLIAALCKLVAELCHTRLRPL